MKNYIKKMNILLGLLLFCVSLQGMEDKQNIDPRFVEWLSRWHEENNINLDSNGWVVDAHIRLLAASIDNNVSALVAKKYNNKNKMICLPQKLHENIFMHCTGDSKNKEENLKQHIKTLLRLRSVCKHFNNILSGEKIGQLCTNHEKNVKDGVFAQLVDSVNDINYWRKIFPCVILVHAGVHPDSLLRYQSYPLLLNCVERNDLKSSKIMLDHGADVNRKTSCVGPIFFSCKTKEMAQLLIKYNLNVHKIDGDENILWWLLDSNILFNYLDLLPFYIEQGVDVKMLRDYDNACLLHVIHEKVIHHVDDLEAVERAKILLPKMRAMVNAHDKKGRTPLDKILERESQYPQLIALLREYDAKTAQELREEQRAQEQSGTQEAYKVSECFICFDKKEKMMKVPCINNKGINNHTEEMCVDCYENCLKHSNLCPLCRAKLKK